MIGFFIAIGAPMSEAKAATATSVQGQWEQPQRGRSNDRRANDRRGNDRRWNDRRNNDRNWNRGRAYSYVTTRVVRRWSRTYRETIRVTRLPNGRVQTQVIRRVRIR